MKTRSFLQTVAVALGILFIVPMTFGQKEHREIGKEKREKIQEAKTAFISKELDLTSEEGEKFWPIYNEMESKIVAEKKAKRKLMLELKENHASFSDAEKKAKVMAIYDGEQREIQIRKEYYTKIGDKIGYTKATKLLSLEERFKRELMQKLKDGKETKSPKVHPDPNK